MKYVFLLLIYASPSFAWEIILDRTNHSGIRNVDVFKQENGEYVFDGKNLGKTLPSGVLTAWKEIEKGPTKSTNTRFCSAGTFTFVKKDNKREQRRQGCTEGDAYGRMIKNIEDIRQYAKGI